MAEETVKREEYFIDWLPRISEKLQFILLNIKEKRDISEEDYFLLEVLHKIWFFGEFPLYRQELNLKEELSIQHGLFDQNSDNTADNENGTEVADTGTETKKEKKK
jgi:hypothetical protein